MNRFQSAGGQVALALLLAFGAWGGGRLLHPSPKVQRLPGQMPGDRAAAHDSAVAYLRGDLSAAASRLLAPRPAGSGGVRVVALLRATDWLSCEDLGRQLRELKRNLPSDSALLVWT